MKREIVSEQHLVILYQFRDYLVSERKLSHNTTVAYFHDIEQYYQYLSHAGITENPISSFTLELLDGFLIYLHGRGLSSRSIVRKLSSLSIFIKFLKIEGILNNNPVSLLNRPRIARALPHYLSQEEIEVLLATFDQGKPEGIRDRALFELIYSAGLRVSETVGLTLHSIYSSEHLVQVIGKGNRERYVPLGERALREIDNWLSKGRPLLYREKKPTDSLFLNFRGEPLSRKGIWRNLKIAAVKAGITTHLTVHTLRHTFATHLIQNGADIRAIQELLGHSDLSTTEIYTHLDMSFLEQVYKRYHIHH